MLRHICIPFSFFAFVVASGSSVAASFDCNKAATAVEFTICGNDQLSSLDEALSAEYRQALSRNPNIRQIQRDWLENNRNNCGAQVDCLVSSYQQQMDSLRNINRSGTESQGTHAEPIPSASAVVSQVANPLSTPRALDPANPIPLLFEATDFYKPENFLSEGVWSSHEKVIFGKPALEWDDEDFAYMEFRLRQQLELELKEAANWISQRNLKSNPEDDSTYVIRSRSINKVIDNIPRFKYWVQQGNTRLAERRAAEELRIKEEMVARQELEKAREIERIQALQDKAVREKKEKKEIMVLMFLALIVATISVIVWNKFFRKRCPRCKSLNFDTTDTREVDRFRTAKMVSERNSKGVNTRSVNAMFVKMEYDYSCGDCGHKWTELKREEL